MRNAFAISIVPIALAVLAACSRPAPESVAPLYDSAPVETRSIEVTVDAAGIIEPESVVELKSKASGEVRAVHAEIGDLVKAKTLLVEIDKRTPRNIVAQTEASLAAAKARRTIAKTQLDRANQLFKSQTLTQADVEKAELEFANADAQVVSSEVSLENARITLEDTDVVAPIEGTIIEKTVEPGIVITSPTQAASGGTVLMKMADLTSVQVRTRVDETDIGKIQPGMPTRVTVAAYPNQPFDGVVLKVEPQAIVEQNVTMFSVLIKLQNRGGVLKPGMNAEVQIKIANRDSVAAVPTAALRADTDVALTAQMLNMDEAALRAQIWPDSKSGETEQGAGKNVLSLGGREIELPPGVDAKAVTALMEKRRGGQELTAEERDLMRKVFQEAGGFAGAAGGPNGGGAGGAGGQRGQGGPRGANFPGGNFPGGGFPGGFVVFQGGPGGPGAAARAGTTNYQFDGEYWVVALRNDALVPVAVRTGLTDLEYSEIVSGLEPGDRVLLLPSTSLYEQQEMLQQFISQRFGSSTPFQQNQQQNIPRQFR
jgi:HlyD family secretion protein